MKDERKLELNFKLELARLPRLEGTADCRSETNVDQRMQIATNKCAPRCLGLLLFFFFFFWFSFILRTSRKR